MVLRFRHLSHLSHHQNLALPQALAWLALVLRFRHLSHHQNPALSVRLVLVC